MRKEYGFGNGQRNSIVDRQSMEQFGNYELVRRIAVGGMGEVYLARQQTAFGREVAVKIIRSDLMHDVVARKRFLREAEVGAYLKHDHILSMVEFGEEQGRLFIVTPYIKGGTLAQRLERGALSLAEVHELFSSLVQAVSYLHKRDVIHRDLKPSNILLDKEEESGRVSVRLIDFGIAAMKGSQMSAPLTTAGEEMGTESFMAPERLNGSVSPSNDIYSLGIILFLMLTGHLPEEADTQSLPQPLEQVIARATAHDPDDRFESADELLQKFEAAYRSLTTSRPRVVPPPPISGNLVEPDMPLPVLQQQPQVPVEAPRFPNMVDVERPVLPPSEKYVKRRATAARVPAQPPVMARVSNPELPVPERSSVRLQRGRGADSSGRMPAIPPLEPGVRRTNATSTPPPQGELKLPPLPGKASAFSKSDYDAPTSHLSEKEKDVQQRQLADIAVVAGTPAGAPARRTGTKAVPKKGARRSLIALVAVLVVALMIGVTGVGYLIFVASISAKVTIAPRVEPVNGVFTLTAKPGIKEMDANGSAMPANVLSSTQSGTQQGTATGISGCVMGIFECKQTVSYADVTRISNKMLPGLKTRIAQDLHTQTSAAGGTMVGNIFYPDPNISSDPSPRTVSQTVNVTVSQQGSVEYVKASDMRSLASTLLKRKVKQDYDLIDTTMQIGQPVIRGVDQKGDVTIAVAAAGISRYHISDSEQATIKNHIKGKTIREARGIITQDPGLDPESISVRVSSGDKVPNDPG
ncbi:MAG: protein kinase, partial [Ktedonobacteraceae bacterium]|nr:protein kinase [Ktedonobacteraceae bacterium]